MTTTLMPEGKQRYFTNTGDVAAGCLLYAYAAGTSTPKTVWQDSAGTVAHAHPIVLDAKGEVLAYFDGAYKIDLKNADGSQITGYPVDNYITDPSGLNAFPALLATSAGSGLVGFLYAATYAAGTIGKWLQDLATSPGSGFIGYLTSTVKQFLDRTSSRFGRISGADLPRFMAILRAYRNDTQPTINIVSMGSSVGLGATLATPLVDAPIAWFAGKLNTKFDPGNLYNFAVSNQCVNGSTASEFPTAWATMLAAGITTPGIVMLCYGMNDQSPAIYNAGQTYPGFYSAMRAAVATAKKAGWDVIICTTPHPSLVLHPEQHSMPVGIAQAYPTIIAANVAPEAMQPPASLSTITADFLGEGTNISVGHRALRINQAMRDVAKEFGCPVIDVERYWFEALQKYQISTGTAAGAEGVLFNSGETVHPNLVGHQNSYQAAINDFVDSLSHQSGQINVEPRLNGYYGMNLIDTLPTAILEIQTPYPDAATHPLGINVRIGATDANGIKAQIRALTVEQATGDILHFGGAVRYKANRVTDGTVSDGVSRVALPYGGTFTDHDCGDINNQIAAPWTIKAFPDNSTGKISISGTNTGIGTSPQMSDYKWKTKAGTLTLTADGTDVGSAVFTVAAVGLSAVATSIANNTNYQARWEARGA